MKKRQLQIFETILLVFCSVQCGRAIYTRYEEFLAKRYFAPTFLIICMVLLIGFAAGLILIWKNEWLAPACRLRNGRQSAPRGLPGLEIRGL